MRKLIFVYNANSGKLNAYLDIAHKILSPSTYQCQLCNLTHGIFREREEWARFREASDDELTFLHKDEFEKEYPALDDYPVVLEETPQGLSPVIDIDTMRQLPDLNALINALLEA